jgi:acetyl-CoA carboxylase carboxyl transferase subunit alpha
MTAKKISTEAWKKVQKARDPQRPVAKHYINEMFEGFIELHGDRLYGDDSAIVAGIAMLDDMPVTVISQHKGSTLEERMEQNFGMAHPEGYRKSLRLMKQAEKFNRPVVCIIDTNGAYPGIGAEERGQATAIAQNLLELAGLKTPVISVIIGEGGSGGALALALSDHIIMLENSIYSVITPEGCASILLKDASKANEIAEHLKLTAVDLEGFKITDSIIPEPERLTAENIKEVSDALKKEIYSTLKKLIKLDKDKLVERRQEKHLSITGEI